MHFLYPCCCGVDTHKKFVVACLLTTISIPLVSAPDNSSLGFTSTQAYVPS